MLHQKEQPSLSMREVAWSTRGLAFSRHPRGVQAQSASLSLTPREYANVRARRVENAARVATVLPDSDNPWR